MTPSQTEQAGPSNSDNLISQAIAMVTPSVDERKRKRGEEDEDEEPKRTCVEGEEEMSEEEQDPIEPSSSSGRHASQVSLQGLKTISKAVPY